MQDYNYLAVGTFELTLELSCCKYPYASELPVFWEYNKDALINFLFEAHIGLYVYVFHHFALGAQWPGGRAAGSESRGPGFNPDTGHTILCP